MEEWLKNHVEIELNKPRPKSILDKILSKGYIKTDLNLKNFDVYQKGTRRLLYNPGENLIDMIYDTKKVFGGIESSSFSAIDFELGGDEE